MAAAGSPSTFIKDEPPEFDFNSSPHLHQMKSTNGATFGSQHSQNFGSWHGQSASLDPFDNAAPNQNFQTPFGSAQNMSSSFIAGSSGVTDDDLLGSFGINSHPTNGEQNIESERNRNSRASFQSQNNFQNGFNNSIHSPPGSNPQRFNFSNTPDGPPIRSPFANGAFDYGHWQALQGPASLSRQNRAMPTHTASGAEKSGSPMSPMNTGLGNVQLSTPDTGSFPGHQVHPGYAPHAHRHSSSAHWDSSLGSGYSNLDSPMSSPTAPAHHSQISEILKNGTSSSSLPAASGPGSKSASSAEIKKAKRRQSHNEVERRRRNHINDQISALSRLVPSHRLEDDAIRRALNSNSNVPGGISATGMSPPQATSLLAGGGGRRAAGTITQGLPIDDKDKGAAKGDVLNGAVGWTQDLLWILNIMMGRERAFQHEIEALGGSTDFQISEDEQRMRSEVDKAFQRNKVTSLTYSRAHGTSLHVPDHTDIAGNPISGTPSGSHTSFPSMSPRMSQMKGNALHESQFWSYPDDSNIGQSTCDFKEEDELDLEMT